MEGTVKWYNRKKGYGFIAGDDEQEYFVHFSGLDKGTFIRDNDKVAFEADKGDKGLIAKNVTLVQKASDMAPEEKQEATEEEPSAAEETEETTEEATEETEKAEEAEEAEEITEKPEEPVEEPEAKKK